MDRSAPTMPNPRHHVGGAALGGKLYVVGGRGEEGPLARSTFERYDPATDRMGKPARNCRSASPPRAWSRPTASWSIVGGEDQNDWEDGGGWVTPSAWAYDPQTEPLVAPAGHEVERRGSGVAAVGDRVYAIGGSYCPGLKPGGPVGTHTVESLAVATAETS